MTATQPRTYSTKSELIELSDHVWQRTWRRLEGLTDEELLWEPYPGCWTVRQLRDGSWLLDWTVPEPTPPPLTTIAWRLCHLIVCYGAVRNAAWLRVEVETEPIEYTTMPVPTTAADALALLDRAHQRWRAILDAVPEDALGEPIGPAGGQYAEARRVALVLHQLDEVIHHAAEIAVLRDLHRARTTPPHPDAVVGRLLQGDLAAFDDADRTPGLVGELAALGRWDLVEAAVARGHEAGGPAPTALHRAAASGNPTLVDALLGARADTTARDPVFSATPAEWADYFGHTAVAERIRSRT